MENLSYVVYLTTNLTNNKKYIGSDSNNNPNYLGSGIKLIEDIKIYGKENFKKDILAKVADHKQMRKLERYYIKIHNADKSEEFYNISKTGVGCNAGKDHHYHRNPRKESSNKKQAYSLLKNKNAIMQYDLQGNFLNEYNNLIELCNQYPIFAKNDVKANCERKQITCHKKIFQYKNDNKIKEVLERLKNDKYKNNVKKIHQYSLQGNFIREWNNGLEIQKHFRENYNIRINSCDIHSCCKGKQKTCRGYKWSYILTKISTKKYNIS